MKSQNLAIEFQTDCLYLGKDKQKQQAKSGYYEKHRDFDSQQVHQTLTQLLPTFNLMLHSFSIFFDEKLGGSESTSILRYNFRSVSYLPKCIVRKF